jgi:NitT/TauT family transport system substrate-binding protein
MTRYLRTGVFVPLLFAVLMAGCSGLPIQPPDAAVAPASAQLTELTVCDSGSTTNALLMLAERAGLFAKHGLAVNLVPVAAGPTAYNALIAGDADICHAGGAGFVNAALAGEELVMTAGTINEMFYALAVLPEVETAEDLRGKVMGASGPGSGSDTFLRLALRFLGLDPDRDVMVVGIDSTSDRLAAMEAGQIAGSAVLVPQVVTARRLGYRTLLTASEMGTPYQHTGIVMTRAFMENNRDAVLSFTQVLVEAIALMKQDRAQAMDVIAETLELDPVADAAYLGEIYDTFVIEYLPRTPYPTREGIQMLIDEGRAANPTAVDIAPEDIVDLSFVQALEADGFIDALYSDK